MPSPATLFQRNKQLYVEEEKKLVQIISDSSFLHVFQDWLQRSIAQLDAQHERCEQQLSELQQNVVVEEGKFWRSKTIIEHCNLHLTERRLVNKNECLENHEKLPELIEFVSCLQQLKALSFFSSKQRQFIEQVEEELHNIVLSPREWSFITNALTTKLKENENTRKVFGDLTSFQNTIEDLVPDVQQCEQLLQASIENGEMKLAEDVSRRQLEIYEHILKLITDQYPLISHYFTEASNGERNRRWSIFRMVDKDITVVIDEKHRQIEACDEDLLKIRDQVQNYSKDDMEQRKRYERDREESNQFLQENKEKQQGVWNKVFEIFKELESCTTELSGLAEKRKKEVDRRLALEEREAGRRSGHDSFIQAAAMHAQKLQDTIDNAIAVRDFSQALNLFVLDGCDSIAAKYDKQQQSLSEMLRLIQQHHFHCFTDYYVAASRYLYRKERRIEQLEAELDQNDMQRELRSESLNPEAKRFAEANTTLALKRREVAQEIVHLRHKLEKVEKAINPTLRSLDFAGVAYTHPREIAFQMNLQRWSSIVDLRETVCPSIPPLERIRREELDTLRQLRAYVEKDASTSPSRPLTAGDESGEKDRRAAPLTTSSPSSSITTTNTVGRKKNENEKGGGGGETVAAAATEEYDWTSMPIKTNLTAEGGGVGWGWGLMAPLRKPSNALPTNTGSDPSHRSGSKESSGGRGSRAGDGGGRGRRRLPLQHQGAPQSALAKRVQVLMEKTLAGDENGKGEREEGGTGSSSHLRASSNGTASMAAASTPAGSRRKVSAPPSLPTRMEGATFRALYPYKARAPDELSFDIHSKIVCISRATEEGWFKGVCQQRTGLFPINYVEPCVEELEP